jgi:2-succinyl-5-enolpyruvyl-6-hydroxy-3-cyclohexene-1-carboxylate synthase
MNAALTRRVVQDLLTFGIREFCICAGARNAPLVSQLEKTEGVRCFSFFEERSASFFALGRIRDSQRPVAVVMTSGTAVAECLPAVIEASYQGLPLLILSADRPRSYRGTGAPQSIEQVGLFGPYVETCIDLERSDESFDLSGWSLRRPLHLNVCFQEPKASEEFDTLECGETPSMKAAPFFRVSESPVLKNPVAIVGPLLEEERPFVEKFLETHAIPFVAEGPSGLRLQEAASRRIWIPEKTLNWGFQKGVFQSVLRLGGVPTLRFWRDLEEKWAGIPVTSCSSLDFTGLSRPSRHVVGLANLMYFQIDGEAGPAIYQKDRECFERLLVLFEKYPRSEASLVREFAVKCHADQIYLGNSLPVREWDLVSGDLSASQVWANRGANGIDGQISSFFGWTQGPGPAAWALIGDLTALYDLAAPWISGDLAERDRRIVIINNFGGQIFKPMFGKEIFLNRHQIRFQKWAEMWNWAYESCETGEVFGKNLSSRQIIELLPDEASSERFGSEWRSM